MNRQTFLGITLSLLVASLAGCVSKNPATINQFNYQGRLCEQTKGMNVVFINVEDLNPIAIKCYGHPNAKTPNIDRLANKGVRFKKAYCQFPLCTPSRSSYLSGMRPTSTGVIHNTQIFHEVVPEGSLSIPEVMDHQGYYMANFGKLFHHGTEPYRVFDELEYCKKPPDLGKKLSKPVWTNKESDKYSKEANRIGDSGKTREQTVEYKIYSDGARLIREKAQSSEPFFLSLGSCIPHAPWICPKNYIDKFPPQEMDMPLPSSDQHRNIPAIANRNGNNFDIYPDINPTTEQIREARAAYFACVNFLDEQVGMVLDEIEKQGIADKTIVIFFSDHGMHLGEHGLFGKVTLFETSLRVPLIIRVPGAPANGQVCDELVELTDIMPTLCELIGTASPLLCDGTSLVPQLMDISKAGHQSVFSMATFDQDNSPEGYSVRTLDYRYSEWTTNTFTFGWAPPNKKYRCLFDMETDPNETVNLIDDPDYKDVVERMDLLLKTYTKKQSDFVGL